MKKLIIIFLLSLTYVIATYSQDLTTSITEMPAKSDYNIGDYIYFGFSTNNIGNDDANSYSYTAIVFSSDSIYDSKDYLYTYYYFDALAANSTNERTIYQYIPNNMAYGEVYVLLVGDIFSYVSEDDETNNTAFIKINVIKPQNLDVQASYLSILTDTIFNNSYFTCRFGYRNNTLIAVNANFKVYASLDNTIDINDELVYNTTYSFPANDTSSFLLSTTTNMQANSTIKLIAVLDYDNYLREVNENNNTVLASTKYVKGSVDLEFESNSIASNTYQNTGTTFSYAVKNKGNGTSNYFYTNIYISKDTKLSGDDFFITNYYSGNLTAGNLMSISSSFNTSIAAGNYYLIGYADATNVNNELSETNNTFAIPFTIESKDVDLGILNANISVNALGNDSSALVDFSFSNFGSANCENVNIGFYYSKDDIIDNSDVLLDYMNMGTISPYSANINTNSISIPSNATSGNHFILVAIDNDGLISETNELNNIVAIPVSINSSNSQPIYDLAVQNVILPAIYRNGANSFSFEIKNKTNLNTPSINFSLYMSNDEFFNSNNDRYLYSTSTGDFIGSETKSYTDYINHYASNNDLANYKYIILKIDSYNYINETNETNNFFVKKFDLDMGSNDLYITSLSTDKTNYTSGSTLNLSFTVNNNGPAIAPSCYTGIYFSLDTILDYRDYSYTTYYNYLNSNSSQNANYGFTVPQLPAGNYYLFLDVDIYKYLGETNELNNAKYTPVNITAGNIELNYSNIFVPTTQVKSENLSIDFEINNTGSQNAPYSNWKIYLSKDSLYDLLDVSLFSNSYYLTSGENIDYSGTNYDLSTYKTMQYYLLFIADESKNVVENNENNLWIKPLNLIEEPVPAAPTANDASRCDSGAIQLKAFGASNGATYRWYDENLDSLAGKTFDTLNLNLSTSTLYYVEIDSAGFLSDMKAVWANIFETPSDSIIKNNDNTLSAQFSGIGVTYQWYKSGVLLPGFTLQELDLNKISGNSGSFKCLVNNNGCTQLTKNLTVSSIDQTLNDAGITVYPVPFKNNLTIRSSTIGSTITIINEVGVSVLKSSLTSDETTINTSLWNSGTYVITITTAKGSVTTKAIKE